MENPTSKKSKILIAGVVLLLVLVVFSGFIIKQLTPVMEKVYVRQDRDLIYEE